MCAQQFASRALNRNLLDASITMTLDRYSHWIASMGRHAADGMDEALGSLPLPYCCQDPSSMIVGSSLFIGFAGKIERADERTRTADLLIRSETKGVAWHCSGL